MKKLTLLAVLLAMGVAATQAVPVRKGVKKTLSLSDGTTVRCELMGDEYLSWWQTEDGTTYRLEADSRLYAPVDLPQLQAQTAPVRQAANARRLSRLSKARRAATLGGEHITYTGTKKGLIILVNFADVSFSRLHSQSFYQKVANDVSTLSSAYGYKGSIKDYFLSQSNDQFELDFDVVGPYTLSQGYAYYGESTTTANDKRPGEMAYEACQLADDDVDFSAYDWDGDGEVEQVVVLYAGPGEASGGDEDTVWPHESSLSGLIGKTLTADGVTVDTYACVNEVAYIYNSATGGYDTTTSVAGGSGIGTICHEFSHCLGLADMYDILYSGYYGMGTYDIMDQGSYNGDSFSPANYTSFERIYCGWVEPIELSVATTVANFPSWDSYPQPFVIYNSGCSDEYYLLENRQQDGWDEELYGSGMLILHVDFDETIWSYNYVNTNANYSDLYNDHQRCTIFHADNESGSTTVRAVAGDPYPGTSGNTSLTDSSSPAATLYNANASGKYYMGKPITGITQNADGTIAFDFMGGSSSNIVYDAIDDIRAAATADDGLVRVYDTSGRLVQAALADDFSVDAIPATGVLIVRRGASAIKVVR